jgi:hypothetical protein
MQFTLEVAVLECSFLKHSQVILGVKNNLKKMMLSKYFILKMLVYNILKV